MALGTVLAKLARVAVLHLVASYTGLRRPVVGTISMTLAASRDLVPAQQRKGCQRVIVRRWNPVIGDVTAGTILTKSTLVRITLQMARDARLGRPLKRTFLVTFHAGHLEMPAPQQPGNLAVVRFQRRAITGGVAESALLVAEHLVIDRCWPVPSSRIVAD
jgi:hypothetical protein